MYGTLVLLALTSGCLAQSGFNCPNNKNGFYPDPVQCDLYYHCENGQAEEKLCPDGLLFDDSNSSKGRCDTPVNVDCGDRTELRTTEGKRWPSPCDLWRGCGKGNHCAPAKDGEKEPQRTEGCPRANGFFRHPDPGVCDKFVNCIDGVPTETPCPPGLIYDDDTSSCSWPTESTRKDCIQTKKDALDDGFSCPEGDIVGHNGRTLPHPTYPHPDDCQKFYICRNGITPQHGACSAGQVYNEETFMCDEPENVPGCENWFKDEEKRKP